MNSKPLIYLAVPYSHPEFSVKEERFHAVNKMAAALINRGMVIFSPISHTHPIKVDAKLSGEWAFWEAFDTAYLTCSSALIVYTLPGWETSVGVKAEIKIAKELGIPISYASFDSNGEAQITAEPVKQHA